MAGTEPGAGRPPRNGSVMVVGAGIVGTCCAVYLRRAGFEVTLVERDAPGEGCSYGNAGSIGIASFTPYSLPDTIRRVPKMLFDRKGALQVRPGRLVLSMPWFLRFLAAGRPSRVERIIAARKALLDRVLESYAPIIADAGAEDVIQARGKLFLYEGDAAFAAGRYDREVRRRGGVEIAEISGDEARQIQPGLSPSVTHAMFVPSLRHCRNPLRLTQALVALFVREGGRVLKANVERLEPAVDGRVRVVTDAGGHAPDQVVLSAGVWSRTLARPFGARIPIESQRGYHVMLPKANVEFRLPVMSVNRNIIFAPMEGGVRVSGIAEHAGIMAQPNYRLADVVAEHARAIVPGLKVDGAVPWSGQRPSTPDSLPVIGRWPGHPTLVFACGHGHTGLTMGAITGRLVAEIAADRPTTIDVAPYRPDRF